MSENTVLILVGVVFGGAILTAIVYYAIRFMKGSIKLSLPRRAFDPGETIAGNFDLHTKKAIQGNKLIVSLIGKQVTRTYEDGKPRTRSHEIYRDEVLIEDAKAYAPGAKSTYDFEISAPDMESPEFLDSTLGQALKTAMQFLGNRSTRIKWKIEARLDAEGVDLATSRSVSINDKQLL